MARIKLVAILTLAVLTLVFVFQNTQDFEVKFLLYRFAFPGAALLFVVFIAGFVFGGLVGASLALRRSPRAQTAVNED